MKTLLVHFITVMFVLGFYRLVIIGMNRLVDFIFRKIGWEDAIAKPHWYFFPILFGVMGIMFLIKFWMGNGFAGSEAVACFVSASIDIVRHCTARTKPRPTL